LVGVLACVAVCSQPVTAPPKPWETWQPPEVLLPNPNGFDTYLKAFALKQQIDEGLHLTKDPVPPHGGARPRDRWGEGPPDLPLEQRVALYAEVLALARQALTQECRIPPPTSNWEPDDYFGQFRATARLFWMEADAHLEKGEFGAAADSAADCICMAQHAGSQHCLLSWFTGRACEAIGERALDEAIPSLNAAECRTVLRRLQGVEARRLPFVQIIGGEATLQRVVFKELMADPDRMREAFETDDDPPMSDGALRLLHDVFMPVSWKRLDEYYDKLLRMAVLPYGERDRDFEPPPDFFLAVAAPHAGNLFLLDASTRTAALLRQLQVAARCFALEKGRPPATLRDLVPTYMEHVPDDPFGTGPLKLGRKDETLLIYSVGPDGMDDEGKPFTDSPLKAESGGDIVVVVPA